MLLPRRCYDDPNVHFEECVSENNLEEEKRRKETVSGEQKIFRDFLEPDERLDKYRLEAFFSSVFTLSELDSLF